MESVDQMRGWLEELNVEITNNKHEFKCPPINSYPHNACEIMSIHLASVLADKFPVSVVQIAHAFDDREDQHFWVEQDDIVLDLTAHQFDGFTAPIVCKSPSPLELKFPKVTRCTPAQALSDANYELNDLLCLVMNGTRQ